MHSLLRISELLELIFLLIPNPAPRDILSCALVSRCWSQVALRLLWNDTIELWMSGKEVERLANIFRPELEKRKGHDFDRGLMYASYLRGLLLEMKSQPVCSILDALHGEDTLFPALKSATFDGNEHEVENFVFGFYLRCLGPTVEEVVIMNHAYSGPIDLAMQRMVSVCTNLKDLTLMLPADSTIPKQIKSLSRLEALTLYYSPFTPNFLEPLYDLVSLKRLELDQDTEPQPREIVPLLNFRPQREGRLLQLERLEIADSSLVINSCLASIDAKSVISELDLDIKMKDGNTALDAQPFPEDVSLLHLEKLTLTTIVKTRAHFSNIFTAVTKFTLLRELEIETQTRAVSISDDDILKSLRNCPRLESLWLSAKATSFATNRERPTLGVIVPLLRECPRIRRIAGCFDLDKDAMLSVEPTIVSSDLEQLCLGTSYFVSEVEPEDWWTVTVGYLSAITSKSLQLELSENVASMKGEDAAQYEKRKDQRAKSLPLFDAAVKAVNSLKGFSTLSL